MAQFEKTSSKESRYKAALFCISARLVALLWKREECVEIEDVLINTNVDVSVIALGDKFHRADAKSVVKVIVFTGHQGIINECWRIREVVFYVNDSHISTLSYVESNAPPFRVLYFLYGIDSVIKCIAKENIDVTWTHKVE